MNPRKERITISFYSPGVDKDILLGWIEEACCRCGIVDDIKYVSESTHYDTDSEVDDLASYLRTCDNTSQSDMSVSEVKFKEKVDLYGLDFYRNVIEMFYDKYKHDHYLIRLFSCVLTGYSREESGKEGYSILSDMMKSKDSFILEAAICIADCWRCLADFADELLEKDDDELCIWLKRIVRKAKQKAEGEGIQ